MKSINYLKLGFVAIVVCSSCTSEQDDSTLTNKPISVDLFGTIGRVTRAYNNVWESEDQIGVYAMNAGSTTLYGGYSNCSYVTVNGDGNFIPNSDENIIYYPTDGSALDFVAYYPYSTMLGGTNDAPTVQISNWNNQRRPQSLDLMLSDKVSGSKTSPDVALTFTHKFSKIILNISVEEGERTTLSEQDLAGMVVSSSGMNVVTTCNILTGELTKGSAVSDNIIFKTENSGKKSTAIVCPDYNTNTENRKVLFRLISGETYSWTIPSDIKLEAGNSYTWNIVLKGQGIVEAVHTATIMDWNENVDPSIVELEIDESIPSDAIIDWADPHYTPGYVAKVRYMVDVSVISMYKGTSDYNVTSMTVDGRSVTPSNTYTFTTTGYHTAAITCDNNSYGERMCNLFEGLTKLTDAFVNSDATELYQTFKNCKSLKSVALGNGVKSINGTFEGCTSLTQVSLSNGLTLIDNNSFSGCTKLAQITIPNNVIAIGESAFDGCSVLSDVSLPDGLRTIGTHAFQDCKKMYRISLPASVESIGLSAFARCTLSNVYIYSTIPPTLGGSGVFSHTDNFKIHVPAESLTAYKKAEYWSGLSSYLVGDL